MKQLEQMGNVRPNGYALQLRIVAGNSVFCWELQVLQVLDKLLSVRIDRN